MPFPANWLEELVAEWLDLEGFVISTAIGVPAGRGGRFAPDVVGAKLNENGLVIRHCEAAMHLTQPEKEAARYAGKFSAGVRKAVEDHFHQIFGSIPNDVTYEKWIITFRPSDRIRKKLEDQGIRMITLRDFVSLEVLPAIKNWKRTETTQLPFDKWLLHMIDWFDCLEFISFQPTQKAPRRRTSAS